MYNINQFKPALYLLLLVGFLGFSLAAESPGVWVLGTGGVLLNAWLVKTGRFVPLPRILANIITIVSMLFIAREAFLPNVTPVMVIGKFLVLLQLIKIWEQRANRDYAQLLILSLLLMVAASINTASLVFGLLLVTYLFLSLYCCLLFHLKVESDSAKAAFAVPADRMSPGILRQDERRLNSSMRRLTFLVSGVAIMAAVVVFLMFPRGAGAGMFGPMQFKPAQTLTGFSENVSFEQLAKITQSNEQVATVTVTRNGRPVAGTEPLLLRGVALDQYTDRRGGAWLWTRTATRMEEPRAIDRSQTLQLVDDPPPGDRYVQRVSLKPTGTSTLFAIAGAIRFTPKRDLKLKYNYADGVIQTDEPLPTPVDYEVVSTGVLPPDVPPNESWRERNLKWERINQRDDRVVKYARNPDVSGDPTEDAPDDAESLAAQRDPNAYVTPLDDQIARNIEDHLKRSFSYTLDLSDAARIRREDDPLIAFLYTLKRGHCEYFAGAMALMCQSLGMQARVVNGFKCDEYNDLGGYYIVRQSHAHSWVEVLTTEGWKTFDPTSSREEQVADGGWWQDVKHFFNFLEFTYGNSVIAYDNDHRDNLIANVESKMQNTTWAGQERLRKTREWFQQNMYDVSSTAIGAAMTLLILTIVGLVAWFLWERWRLRRRAARIGLDVLPTSDQLRLLRQLGFYDELIRLLARHHITRPRHLTPLEFSQSLIYLPGRAFETVRRLTEIFYRVRYGEYDLSHGLRRRLDNVIADLEQTLGPPPAKSKAASI